MRPREFIGVNRFSNMVLSSILQSVYIGPVRPVGGPTEEGITKSVPKTASGAA